jgi:hypothetical protein
MMQYITATYVKLCFITLKQIYYHSTVITEITLLYNTEWQCDYGLAVNYCSKKLYNILTWGQCNKTTPGLIIVVILTYYF